MRSRRLQSALPSILVFSAPLVPNPSTFQNFSTWSCKFLSHVTKFTEMFLWFCEPWIVPVMTKPKGSHRACSWLSGLFNFRSAKTSCALLTSFPMSTYTFLNFTAGISMSTRCECNLLSISSERQFSAMVIFSVTSPSSTVMTCPCPLADCNLNCTTSNSSSSCCKSVLTGTTSFRPFRSSSLATSELIMVALQSLMLRPVGSPVRPGFTQWRLNLTPGPQDSWLSSLGKHTLMIICYPLQN